MQKNKFLLSSIFVLILPLMVSCSLKNKDMPFISEVFCKNSLNGAIEITNTKALNEDVYINFYKSNEILYSRNLKDDFKNYTNTSIVYLNSSFKESLDYEKVIRLDGDYSYGFNYIEIVDKKGNVVDSIGNKTYDITYINNGTLIRNENSLYPIKDFTILNWYKVIDDPTYNSTYAKSKYLGNLNTPISYDKFLEGPKLNSYYFNDCNFLNENNGPGGGVHETSVISYGDGDTTIFDFEGISNLNSVERTRYYYIDTPETSHPDMGIKEDEWGEYAADFTNSRLKNAKSIVIQSALGGQLRETYGRLLGFVWYSNVENPTYSDYTLLNYELAINGLCEVNISSDLDLLVSSEIPYHYYFKFALEYAKSKGLKMWGEKDPKFN